MDSRDSGRPKLPARVGPYRIEGRLGIGGMGAVLRASDERLKRPVALKHILPELSDPVLRERFRREAQAAASLNHASIVHIYDIVESESGDWIVMELVEGERLDLLLRRGPLALRRALRLAREIARGLAEAHAKGIVHRDLKAENVMVTPGGHAKILDFGLAKLTRDSRDSGSTTEGAVLGTARTMSPEQVMGLGVDQRSDLFSLGTLLYEMLTARSPFKSDAVVETLRRVCTLRQIAVDELRRDVPGELSVLIDHLLEKDPERRPKSARDVIAELVRISEAVAPESLDERPDSEVAELLEQERETMPELVGDRQDSSSFPRKAFEATGDLSEASRRARHDHRDTTVPHRPLAASARDTGAAPRARRVLTPAPQAEASETPAPPAEASQAEAGETTPTQPAVQSAVSATRGLEVTERRDAQARPFGERRQVTVLCCDLLGRRSDGSFSVLDPETLYEVLPEFRTLANASIRRFEGHLGKVLGHRLWAYFGYPRAHEDDAERAVRSALDLVARVGELGAELAEGQPLALRAGIHTGPAVVTPARPSEEEIALGSTLERTVGIHDLAEPHGVVVSEGTFRLVEAAFETEALRPSRIRGFGAPHTARRIVALREMRHRIETGDRLTPLVGRSEELDLVLGLWKRARSGEGQVVFLSGEAGIGKTRLVLALRERLRHDGPNWWITGASPFTRNSPLQPVADLVRGVLDFTGAAPRLELLQETLAEHGLAELVPLLVSLLGLPLPERHPSAKSAPGHRRTRALAALNRFFVERTRRHRAVMVIEDLQWADPSTLEMLDLLLDQVAAAPLLVVLTYRPDFEVPWKPRGGVTRIELDALGERDSALLVDRVAEPPRARRRRRGGRVGGLPPEIRRQIVRHTDGIPLFIEELTKSLLESGLAAPIEGRHDLTPSTPFTIPTTLRDSLTARLDRLGTAKALAQRAAVIGREFSFDLLAAVSRLDERSLDYELERLLRSELVYHRPSAPAAGFHFKHALVQEVAYRSLLRKERRRLHLDIARALESRSAASGETPPEVVARHYTRARVAEKAAAYWLEAGRRALERSASVESVEHLRRGLNVLGGLPPGGPRDTLELTLECSLLPALLSMGEATGDFAPVVARIHELSRATGLWREEHGRLQARVLLERIGNGIGDRFEAVDWKMFQNALDSHSPPQR